MIVMDGNQIRLGSLEERIKKWEVWFHTPWGLCPSIHDAVEACKKADIDPEMAIIPTPVAVGPTTYEAYVRG